MKKLLLVVAVIAVAIVAILAIALNPAEAKPLGCGPEPLCEEGQITVTPAIYVPEVCPDCPTFTFEVTDDVCPEGYPKKSGRHPGYCYKGYSPDWPEDYKIMVTKVVYTKTFTYGKSHDPHKCHRPTASSLGIPHSYRSKFNSDYKEWLTLECKGDYWIPPVCRDPIIDCMDDAANNYNPDADENDVSLCTYDVPGCTDDSALNFNPDATVDDGSCEYFVEILGCTDEGAYNFNPEANTDDGTCVYDVCPNLEGLQEEIPEGMIKPGKRCIPKPILPVDLCDNIEGFQDEVPEGLIWDEKDNTCNKPEEKKKENTCDDVLRMWMLWDQYGRECYIISDTHPGVERQQVLCKWACDDRPFVSIQSWSGMVDSCNNWELDEYASYPRLHVDDLKKVLAHEYQTEIGGGAEFCPAGG